MIKSEKVSQEMTALTSRFELLPKDSLCQVILVGERETNLNSDAARSQMERKKVDVEPHSMAKTPGGIMQVAILSK